jgi:predicted nucleic acid-binding protein
LRFWDSSALLPLLAEQTASEAMNVLLREGEDLVVWWGTWAECAVAISRLKREDSLDEESEQETRVVLDEIAADWTEVEPIDDMRLLASLLSKDHPLKTADALQLAAALRWCEGDTTGRSFVCLDNRLREAAMGEDFGVLPERP